MFFSPSSGLPSHVEFFTEREFPMFEEHPKAMVASLKKMKDLSFFEAVNSLKYVGNDRPSNVFLVKFHRIFADAVACLLVLLLAIPCAVLGTRVNPFVRMAKASCYLLLFWVANVTFTTLGSNGTLNPAMACWIANFAIIFPAMKLFNGAM
jgi:lipopolysaccharide export LptBFGC system permease protein LptF